MQNSLPQASWPRPATILFVLYVLGWLGAVLFVYTSRTTWIGESGSGVSYSVPAAPLATGLVATGIYWLGLSLLAVFDEKRRRFFVRLLVLAVALVLALGVAFMVAKTI